MDEKQIGIFHTNIALFLKKKFTKTYTPLQNKYIFQMKQSLKNLSLVNSTTGLKKNCLRKKKSTCRMVKFHA